MAGVRNLDDDAYDTSAYLQRARERKRQEEEARTSRAKSRSMLTARTGGSLELDKASGTRSFVSVEIVGEREVKRGAGFYCEVCTCTLRDSQAYMAHLNSRNHLANAGFAMKVERSSASQVKQRFAKHTNSKKKFGASLIGSKRRPEGSDTDLVAATASSAASFDSDSDYNDKKSPEDELRKNKRVRIEAIEDGTMHSTLVGSAPSNNDVICNVVRDEEEGDSGDGEGSDDDNAANVMALMGFSGFGTSKNR